MYTNGCDKMQMIYNIGSKINRIINSVDETWPTIVKIRYVYIEIGKILQKYTEFFWSVNNKLGEKNFSIEKLRRIYEDDKGDLNSSDWEKVICKSAASILKIVFDRLGIESKLVKSTDSAKVVDEENTELLINHWFLAVKDEECTYFLTLVADLPYIQNGLRTRHFASNIPYYRIDINGEKHQTYEGECINHTVIDNEKIKEIDIFLGYLNTYTRNNDDGNPSLDWKLQYVDAIFGNIKRFLRNNDWYYQMEAEETSLYKKLTVFSATTGKEISLFNQSFSSILKEEWDCFIRILCNSVEDKIKQMLQITAIKSDYDCITQYEQWLESLSNIVYENFCKKYLPKDTEAFNLTSNISFSSWARSIKKHIAKNAVEEYHNPLLLLEKTNSIIVLIRNGRFEKQNFSMLLHYISFHFLDESHIFIDKDYVPNEYIANKFNRMFKKVFSCNEEVLEFNNTKWL